MNNHELKPYFTQNALTLGLFETCIGDVIGSGCFRTVCQWELEKQFVVKIERSADKKFCNAQEWDIWNRVKSNKAVARWFAPCADISPCGLFLFQYRTQPVTVEELKKRLPRVPRFFTDTKAANWGKLGHRIVCHDYGNNFLVEDGMKLVLKKANWWE